MTAKRSKLGTAGSTKTAKPAATPNPKPALALKLNNYQLFLVLALVNIVTRLPLAGPFNMVTFDGTYYINQARFLLRGAFGGGSFPVGYPAFIAALIPIVRDDVVAAQIISFLAGLGTTIVFYLLACRFMSRPKAFLAALIVAIHPLFIALSLLTYSESLYIFFVFLALWLYAAGKRVLFGVAMGLAVITRPEALAILGLLMLLKIRRPKWIAAAGLAFAVLYSINVAYLSKATGRVVLLPKSEFFGAAAQKWQLREQFTEFEGKDDVQKTLVVGSKETTPSSYVKRLPLELRDLHSLVLPVLAVLAAFGAYRKPTFILMALVPFLFIPAFTVRTESRYLLPYVPVIILYGFIGAEAIKRTDLRRIAYSLAIISAAILLVVHEEQWRQGPEPEYRGSKAAAQQFKGTISPTDKIADRKPFFAFYSGGQYVEIPLAPYQDVMKFLVRENVRFLSLHITTTPNYRPILTPLLFDRASILGELRYEQVYYAPTGELIYEKARDNDPLESRPFGELPGDAYDPCWSPDGTQLACRVVGPDGSGGLYVVTQDGASVRLIMPIDKASAPLTWSPDGKRIAFSLIRDGNADIYAVDVRSGGLTRLTSDPAEDIAPSWARNGREIAFCSNRSGAVEIWITDLVAGRAAQLSTGGENRFPIFANRGDRIAWVSHTNLVILDRTTSERTDITGNVTYRPAWSPDDRYLAAENYSGTANVCLIMADGTRALLLTKGPQPTGMPSWSSRSGELAVVTKRQDRLVISRLSGLEDYLERLEQAPDIAVFTQPMQKPISQ
jgi:hypothetical protein